MCRMNKTAEQEARGILDRMGISGYDYGDGDLVELANILRDRHQQKDVKYASANFGTRARMAGNIAAGIIARAYVDTPLTQDDVEDIAITVTNNIVAKLLRQQE